MKIFELDALARIIDSLKSQGKKIVHCHGVFDLLHIGHIRYFSQARRMGDVLVVTITPDQYVDKGPHRPAFAEALRAEAVASLDSVDYVAINRWPTAEETLRRLRPDYYVKGSEFKKIHSDMTGKIAGEANAAREIGATLAFTDDIVFSSSNLINRYLANLPSEIKEYLELFCHRFTLEEVLKVIDQMASLKVLVIGDTIIDDYQYCDTMGKSSKDPALALKYKSNDLFAGGVLAVANHTANFSGAVDLLTVIGEKDSYRNFIQAQLNPNISAEFLTQPLAPTVIKRRFVDGYSFNKLFEVYIMDDTGLPALENDKACDWLKQHLSDYDIVIAADFGHGAISQEMKQMLVDQPNFLAVNTQANAGNRGFHTISRYPRADYVCIAEHELRLEARNLNGNIRYWMERFTQKLNSSQFVVTRGRKGCAVSDKSGGFVQVPTFAQKVVDRVGAGDAFFAVTSLAASQNPDNEVLGFLGNVVGSLAVEIIGNKKAIDKLSVKKYITSLMK